MGGERMMGDLLQGMTESAAVPPVPVSGLSMDSRQLRAGDLFLARSGGQCNGVDFIDEAWQRGAAAVVVDAEDYHRADNADNRIVPVENLSARTGLIAARFFDFPSRTLHVIGVTGTNGKTTVTWLLAHALNALRGGTECGLIGTLGCGIPPDLHAADHTTPDVVTLNRLLGDMRDEQAGIVVMEVSSHALDQRRVDGIDFTAAVFTNLGHDHMDYHADRDAYARAKHALFTYPPLQTVVFNLDDQQGRFWFDEWHGAGERWGYHLSTDRPASADRCLHGAVHGKGRDGMELVITGMNDGVHLEGRLTTPLIGRAAAANLMAAATTLVATGISLPEALSALSRCPPVPGRMECFSQSGRPWVIVDYAHNPDALEAVLSDLKQWSNGRLWCVFGCGGDRDRDKRPLMAATAARYADEIVLTSDNLRHESLDRIMQDICRGFPAGQDYHREPDRAAAIAYAVTAAGAEDTVLIAGKGHETWQEIAGERHFFSDRDHVREALS